LNTSKNGALTVNLAAFAFAANETTLKQTKWFS
jgi:hypothetical protein